MASTGRSRRCALCQQYYGSGFLDNVAAGELLRARRMLMERSTDDDGPSSRLVREAFDQFLTDLTRQREVLDLNQRHMPLDVCAFCVQFLPSSYNVNCDAEEDSQSPVYAAAGRSVTPLQLSARRCRAATQGRSSLVIQHQFPGKRSTPTALGNKNLQRPRMLRPRSSASPRPAPTYRLLSSDAARVLRIESPTAALDSVTMDQSSAQNNTYEHLATANVMSDLRAQEQQQATAILRSETSRREASYRRRISAALTSEKIAQERTERLTGVVAPGSSQHQNIVNALTNEAGALYTGIVVVPNESRSQQLAPRNLKDARIVTIKHNRHFKTELLFPAIPVSTRATPKKASALGGGVDTRC